MALMTSINDSAWGTSGAATAGNTGFNSLGTSIFDVDENGEKCITTAATNTSLAVRIDAAAAVFASGETRYHCELVAYLEFTGASNSTSIGTIGTNGVIDFFGAGPRGYCQFFATNSDHGTGLYFTFTGADGATAGDQISGLNGAPIPINTKFTIGAFADRTAGVAGCCINGVRVGTWTATPVAAWDSTVTLTFPAVVGGRWRIYATSARPARSWSGTDHTFTPLFTEYASSTDALYKSFPHIASDGLHGTCWTYTGTHTLTNYETSGTNPNRKRMIGGVGGVVAEGNFNIGTPPYNEYGDFAIITSLYVPSGGTWSLAIRNTADDADVIKLQVASAQLQDSAGVQLTASDTTAVAVAVNKRYFLIINLSRNGKAAFTLISASDDPSARIVWSGALANWTPQDLGIPVFTASSTVEADRVDVCSWFTNAMTDSIVAAYCANVTPLLVTTANNYGLGFPCSDAACGIPGSGYASKWYGWPRESWMVTTARSGTTRAQWNTNVRPYLTHTRAMRLVTLDGACINDISGGTLATAVMTIVSADLAFCNTNNNQLVLMPSFPRPLALAQSLSVDELIQQREFNRLLRAFVVTNASNPRLFFCDHQRAYREVMLTTDGIHPTSASVASNTRAIAGALMTARQYASFDETPSSAGGTGLSNGNAVLSSGTGLMV